MLLANPVAHPGKPDVCIDAGMPHAGAKVADRSRFALLARWTTFDTSRLRAVAVDDDGVVIELKNGDVLTMMWRTTTGTGDLMDLGIRVRTGSGTEHDLGVSRVRSTCHATALVGFAITRYALWSNAELVAAYQNEAALQIRERLIALAHSEPRHKPRRNRRRRNQRRRKVARRGFALSREATLCLRRGSFRVIVTLADDLTRCAVWIVDARRCSSSCQLTGPGRTVIVESVRRYVDELDPRITLRVTITGLGAG